MSKLLIENIDYVVTIDDAASVLRNVSILIEDGVITAIGDIGELRPRRPGSERSIVSRVRKPEAKGHRASLRG